MRFQRFWHRLHLSGYSDYAKLMINMLPSCVTRNILVRKVLMTFLLFFMSGLIHQLTTWQLDSDCSDYADIRFFCMNAVAVILESVVLQRVSLGQATQDAKRRDGRHESLLRSTQVTLVRLVGYTWVVTFFVWAVPKVYYPRVYCMLNQQMHTKQD